MSHIVSIQTKVHDPFAVAAACTRLGLAEPVAGTAKLYSGKATGLIVQFPDWRFPAVIDTLTGQIQFDHYHGHWGDQKHLDRFMQAYGVEKAKLEARRNGYAVNEQPLHDGGIKLQIITEA